jgi:hypothetical protein
MNTITANGSTTPIKTDSGHRYFTSLQGNFAGATIALEWSLDGITWSPLHDSNGAITYTESGQGSDFVAPGTHLRLTTTNAGATSVNYNLAKQP